MSRNAKRRVPKVDRGEKLPLDTVLPNRIKAMRLQRYMTQTELAELMGVSRISVSNWETGQRSVSDMHKVELCKVLKCSIHDLFNWEV